LEPFGDERGDVQAGVIASTIANVNRNQKKSKAFSIGDFMPYVPKPESRTQDLSDQIKRAFKQLGAADG
tara:strand:+ start:8821 stop:9027 length:207 start_codon:yes stop_codon:yes gene_type:complete